MSFIGISSTKKRVEKTTHGRGFWIIKFKALDILMKTYLKHLINIFLNKLLNKFRREQRQHCSLSKHP